MQEIPQNMIKEYVVPPGVQQVQIQVESHGLGSQSSTVVVLQVKSGQVLKLHISYLA
jgi:hypothetical protein